MADLIGNQWADSAGHWYTRTGGPAYRVIGKNGKERATTIRDARELGLVPSVTTILALEAKPALTNWLVTQGMLACLTLPRLDGEDDQTFMARAIQDSRAQSRKAAERGTYMHGLLEEAVRVRRIPVRATREDETYIVPVLAHLDERFTGYTWSAERSFATEDYGGKIDLSGIGEKSAVIDYKFKDFNDPDKRLAYDEHASQLAAYSHGLGYNHHCRHVNLFISSTVPGLIVHHEWDDQSIRRAMDAFNALLSLWKARKGR